MNRAESCPDTVKDGTAGRVAPSARRAGYLPPCNSLLRHSELQEDYPDARTLALAWPCNELARASARLHLLPVHLGPLSRKKITALKVMQRDDPATTKPNADVDALVFLFQNAASLSELRCQPASVGLWSNRFAIGPAAQ